MTPGKAVIIGGGVIGAASAYYLSKAGWKVTVVDRGRIGGACSHANCGYVCPSHVLPLAAPGAIRMALGTLFTPNSPFYMKPRLSFSLLSWMFKFARRCNRKDMLASGHAIQSLLNSSRQLYEEIIRDEQLECEWEREGLLFVFNTQKAMDHYAEVDHLLRDRYNMGADRYDGDALTKLEPSLKPGFPGAWHYKGDAHLRPDKLMSTWKKAMETRGVEFIENCEVTSFETSKRMAQTIQTNQGPITADAFVIATGAWTPLLRQLTGSSFSIQPGKGYSITMPRPAICPRIPLIFEEHRVAVTPMQSGYRVGSMMEFVGYDDSVDQKRVEILKHGARHYLREPLAEPILETWTAWRPMTPDGKPYIDRSKKYENVIVAAGHSMLGLSMAPATGKLVSELLNQTTPHVDPQPFAWR